MVISPEHPMIEQWADKLNNIEDVRAYREEAARKSDFERTELNKDKTGVKLDGVAAINPVNGKEIPIFVSDYVLMGYGTGAIMAVPAHDDRDWEFAKKFGCEIIEVVSGGEDVQKAAFTAKDETGILVNSDFLNGKTVKDAIPAMIEWLGEKGIGRARYSTSCATGYSPVSATGASRSRSSSATSAATFRCRRISCRSSCRTCTPTSRPTTANPACTHDRLGQHHLSVLRRPAKRETDTMPQWAGSSWYFLRYMDPHNDKALASKEALEYWSPVDWYNGGMEHTTLHLLYSRFWHKFLYDIGVVPTRSRMQSAPATA